MYLPYDGPDDGVTPGNNYPVFQADFGNVGMMICWDSSFADPARALALTEAEIILMPIWDGFQTLVKARGMENEIFLVTSSYGDPSFRIRKARSSVGIHIRDCRQSTDKMNIDNDDRRRVNKPRVNPIVAGNLPG